MEISSYDNAVNYKATESQKECCAVIAMREAVESLALREKIPYEEALLRFTSSRAYEALFDFDTVLITFLICTITATLKKLHDGIPPSTTLSGIFLYPHSTTVLISHFK